MKLLEFNNNVNFKNMSKVFGENFGVARCGGHVPKSRKVSKLINIGSTINFFALQLGYAINKSNTSFFDSTR